MLHDKSLPPNTVREDADPVYDIIGDYEYQTSTSGTSLRFIEGFDNLKPRGDTVTHDYVYLDSLHGHAAYEKLDKPRSDSPSTRYAQIGFLDKDEYERPLPSIPPQ